MPDCADAAPRHPDCWSSMGEAPYRHHRMPRRGSPLRRHAVVAEGSPRHPLARSHRPTLDPHRSVCMTSAVLHDMGALTRHANRRMSCKHYACSCSSRRCSSRIRMHRHAVSASGSSASGERRAVKKSGSQVPGPARASWPPCWPSCPKEPRSHPCSHDIGRSVGQESATSSCTSADVLQRALVAPRMPRPGHGSPRHPLALVRTCVRTSACGGVVRNSGSSRPTRCPGSPSSTISYVRCRRPISRA